jgi:hypothetical protein
MGFGLAGGGYGAYQYCPKCEQIVQKWQEDDGSTGRASGGTDTDT